VGVLNHLLNLVVFETTGMKPMKNPTFQILIALGLMMAACSPAAPAVTPTPAGPRTLRVMTHDSFAVSEAVIAAFESQYNAKVQILPSGDAGTALNKAILAKGNPIADVFYGLDNTFLSRALKEEIFDAYASPALEGIPTTFRLDPQMRALPVDYGDVCPNVDLAYFQQRGLALPNNLEDLLKPEYKGLLVVENPATSSPGLAFLLATIGHFGEQGYLDYWKGLVDNEVLVVNDWNNAYYSEFSAHGGTRPVAISYGSSPPVEVIFAEKPLDAAPTGVISAGGSCFRQIEFAGILKGARDRDLAENWLDFMLSTTFQEDMPLQMFVYPVNPQAKLPEEFTRFVTIPEQTSVVAADQIDAKREGWIQAWTEVVLR
jgi:thiamine transport system substrate-binding protein